MGGESVELGDGCQRALAVAEPRARRGEQRQNESLCADHPVLLAACSGFGQPAVRGLWLSQVQRTATELVGEPRDPVRRCAGRCRDVVGGGTECRRRVELSALDQSVHLHQDVHAFAGYRDLVRELRLLGVRAARLLDRCVGAAHADQGWYLGDRAQGTQPRDAELADRVERRRAHREADHRRRAAGLR